LITHTRPDVVAGRLASHKSYFIRNDTTTEYPTLASVIEHVQPTALVGLSTTFGAFTEPCVRRMAELNPSPIIFPLSNPTSKCELSYADALEWTGGNVLFASGSPYDPIEFQGVRREPGQGNNFLVFPGIGFGAVICKAKKVTDLMITAGAMALSESLTPEEKELKLLYPRTGRIREVSAEVARGVVRAAQVDGVDEETRFRDMSECSGPSSGEAELTLQATSSSSRRSSRRSGRLEQSTSMIHSRGFIVDIVDGFWEKGFVPRSADHCSIVHYAVF
jgi:malate dehydrogenase (oxaloacetate-decarboxylating)(NADP+)